jgi:hypothetical protein
MAARPNNPSFGFTRNDDKAYAINILETVTWLAGQPDYLDGLREGGKSLDLFGSTGRRRSAKVFEWLMASLSYQGISDSVARSYMAAHETPAWPRSHGA